MNVHQRSFLKAIGNSTAEIKKQIICNSSHLSKHSPDTQLRAAYCMSSHLGKTTYVPRLYIQPGGLEFQTDFGIPLTVHKHSGELN